MASTFLSDEWFEAVEGLRDEAPEPPAAMKELKLNIVVAIAAAVCIGLTLDGTGGGAARRLRQALKREAGRNGDAHRASSRLPAGGRA